jgi:large subunit ribosomal protein L20
MSRVKRGTIGAKRRRKILKMAKGYRYGRGTKERQAREAILHAGVHAFTSRRDKKNDYRRLWQVRINACLHGQAVLGEKGLSYSKFIGALKKKNIELDRKILSTLAEKHPRFFEQVVAESK